MIRIAHLKSFYGQIGGIESLLEGAAPALAARPEAHCRMVLVSHDEASQIADRLSGQGALPLDRLEWTGLSRLRSNARALEALLRASGSEVVHTHDMRANLLASMVHKRLGIPWIAHIHGWLGHTHVLRYRLYEALDKRLIRQADHVLTGSHATLAEVQAAGARSASVVWNAVPMPETPVAPSNDKVQIAILGRVHYGKGQDLLVEALAALAENTAWQAVIVGAGSVEDEAKLTAQIAEKGLQDRITCTGFVSSTRPYLEQSDIVVVPSRKESLPLTCLEGMAWGRAVVVSEAGDLPRVVTHGETGLVVPIDDSAGLAAALSELIGNPALRQRLGAAARLRIASHHTADSLAKGMVQAALDLCPARETHSS